MRVTVLGCWAPFPAAGGACSSYLVDTGSSKILLDAGHGSFGKLQEAINFRQLDLVIISHWHPDHWHDLPCLRHAVNSALQDGSRRQKLPVYLPEEPGEEYRQALQMTDGLEIIPLDRGREVAIPGGKISFFAANHPLPTFGTVIEAAAHKLVYSADTGLSPALEEAAQGCRLLICEASLLEKDQGYAQEWGHLTAAQAATIARDAGAGMLLLTHLWPQYNLADLHSEAKEIYPGAILAAEGLVLEL